MPDFSNPGIVKNFNEVLRCFDTLCKKCLVLLTAFMFYFVLIFFCISGKVFSDRIISYLLLKLEKSAEKGRLGSLSVLKQLVNFSG